MTTPVQTLFNPSVGIQSLLPMADAEPLPDAREVGASAVGRSTLESLYGPANARARIEHCLAPDIGDGTPVSPEVFARSLRDISKKLEKRLKKHPDPKLAALLEEELEPLLENDMLLSAYRGLMLGG